MKIKFLCPRWGFEHTDWETFLTDVETAGYAGIEWFPYGENADPQHVIDLLQQHQLEFAIVMTVTGHHEHFENYLAALKDQLLHLSTICSPVLSPLHISAQTGREYFSPQILFSV